MDSLSSPLADWILAEIGDNSTVTVQVLDNDLVRGHRHRVTSSGRITDACLVVGDVRATEEHGGIIVVDQVNVEAGHTADRCGGALGNTDQCTALTACRLSGVVAILDRTKDPPEKKQHDES